MRLVLAAIGAVVLWVGLVSVATAATFDVRVCDDDFGLSSRAPVALNSNPSTVLAANGCHRDPTADLDGLAAADLNGGAPNTPGGATASWTLSAVPGTSITSVRLSRYLGKRDNTWSIWTRTGEGQTLESCQIVESLSCTVGAPPTDSQSMTTYAGLNTSAFSWGVSCTATVGDCGNGYALHDAWAVVYSLTATIDDPAPPQLQPLAGSLVAPARWHSGTEQATVVASDASGSRRLDLLVDGVSVFGADQPCDFSLMRPCPADTQLTANVDLTALRDGVHQIAARAIDAAGQATTSAPTAIAVDTRPPGEPVGLDVVPNDDGSVSARWSNPDHGTGAPIAAAHYQFCPIASDANCAGGGIASGDGITSLDHVRPPAGGSPWDLVVWLQDAAGHADRALAARKTVVVAQPPGSGGGRRPPTRSTPSKRLPKLRIAGVALRDGRLRVRGTAATALRARVAVALRRTRHGRPRVWAVVLARRGHFRAVLGVHRRGVSRRDLLTVYFRGNSHYRRATLVRPMDRGKVRGLRRADAAGGTP